MASRLRVWVRQVTRPQTREAARWVAARLLEGVEDAGQRLTALARAGQPALRGAAVEQPAVMTVETAEPTEPAEPAAPRHADASPARAPVAPAAVSPQDAAWTLARHVSERLDVLRQATLHTDLRDSDGRHDPHAVRTVRISARRLQSLVELFGPWLGRKRSARMQRELRTITRALGPLRDLDGAAAALAKASERGTPLLRAAAEQIRTSVALEQAAALEAAERAFADVELVQFERDLDRLRHRVSDRIIAAGPALPSVLAEAFGQLTTTLFTQTPIPRTLENMEAVHDVRITAKRLRYALEWIRPALRHGPGPKRALKRAQRVVGKARDLELRATAVRGYAASLHAAGSSTLAEALGPWLEQIERAQRRATERILPALDPLDPATVETLSREALGCAAASDKT